MSRHAAPKDVSFIEKMRASRLDEELVTAQSCWALPSAVIDFTLRRSDAESVEARSNLSIALLNAENAALPPA